VSADARRLLWTRALRGFVDGAVSVLLASYLTSLGFSPVQVGAIVTGTLVGSAALTLAVGLGGHHWPLRSVLLAAATLMAATGLGFALVEAFWPLLLVAVVGTLNPSSGDVSVFLPTEQAVLADAGAPAERTTRFAWYNLSGTLAGALGALASGLPLLVAHRLGVSTLLAERAGFVGYAAVALVLGAIYRGLSPRWRVSALAPRSAPLEKSRGLVLELAALFSLDSFGGGFVVQSLLVFWLQRRFALPASTVGAVFFAAGLAAAFSQLVSGRLAARIGHVRTMVYTHLPANLFLVLAGVMPTAGLAIGFLLLRMALSQMDVPARQAYVMAMVPPEERTAAASVTNVPRSLAAAIPPLLTGWMLEHSSFGWPLLLGGVLKATYDGLLLWRFQHLRPSTETA
jgi:MFS family permease